MSGDFERFTFLWFFINSFWIIPFQLLMISYFLWDMMGISSLLGLVFILFIVYPTQAGLKVFAKRVSKKLSNDKNKRLELMSQIIGGMKVIKMYAWEPFFKKIINDVRIEELKHLNQSSNLQNINDFLCVMIFNVGLYFSISSYALFGGTITTEKIFPTIYLFNVIRISTGFYLPIATQLSIEFQVKTKHIEKYLLKKPIQEEKNNQQTDVIKKGGIRFEQVQASWNPNSQPILIKNLQIEPGSLIIVIGAIGSGKTTLLNLILGELQAQYGKVCVNGNVSYCPQEPWLFGSTIRSNILLGQKYDAAQYRKVLRLCCLEADISGLPNGDLCLVGEKGIALSGGQRARINLARAVYKNADFYLLDDPLSAVDAQVGNQLFENCIGGFLKNKTRILVTHHQQFVRKADLVIFMKEVIFFI